MPNFPDVGARYIPRAWSYDDCQPAGTDRLRRAGTGGRRGHAPRGTVLAAGGGPVLAVAGQLAEVLGGAVRPVRRLSDACRIADAEALVLPARSDIAELVAAVGLPVVAVPAHAQPTGVIRRVLVCLDETPWTDTVRCAGRELIAVPGTGPDIPALALRRRSDLVVLGWPHPPSADRTRLLRALLDLPPAPLALVPVT